MEIDKSSWHYRLLTSRASVFRDDIEEGQITLCSYFWHVVFWLPVHVFCYVIICAAMPIIFVMYLRETYAEKFGSDNPDKPKREGVVTSYLKAKKQKICPVIDFVDS